MFKCGTSFLTTHPGHCRHVPLSYHLCSCTKRTSHARYVPFTALPMLHTDIISPTPSHLLHAGHRHAVRIIQEVRRTCLARRVLAHTEHNGAADGMPSVVHAVGMVVATSVVLADVYYRASTLLTNMTYTPSQPHAEPHGHGIARVRLSHK